MRKVIKVKSRKVKEKVKEEVKYQGKLLSENAIEENKRMLKNLYKFMIEEYNYDEEDFNRLARMFYQDYNLLVINEILHTVFRFFTGNFDVERNFNNLYGKDD